MPAEFSKPGSRSLRAAKGGVRDHNGVNSLRLVECPQRVALDAFGDISDRDEINPFIRLLWERGTLFEKETIANLRLPFVDLSNADEADREQLTLAAMTRGEPLIYGGCIRAGDLFGMPDLLRKEPGGYVAGDVKSGRGKEGGDDDHDGKPKLHYAVQLALYVDILEHLNLSAGRRAFVLDIRGDEVTYDFTDLPGENLWDDYENALKEARSILAQKSFRAPAMPAFANFAIGTPSVLRNSPQQMT